jgi:hypothetical protein
MRSSVTVEPSRIWRASYRLACVDSGEILPFDVQPRPASLTARHKISPRLVMMASDREHLRWKAKHLSAVHPLENTDRLVHETVPIMRRTQK